MKEKKYTELVSVMIWTIAIKKYSVLQNRAKENINSYKNKPLHSSGDGKLEKLWLLEGGSTKKKDFPF